MQILKQKKLTLRKNHGLKILCSSVPCTAKSRNKGSVLGGISLTALIFCDELIKLANLKNTSLSIEITVFHIIFVK